MHFSIIPPGPNTSAMLGEGVDAAEALAEGAIQAPDFCACYLNTVASGNAGSNDALSVKEKSKIRGVRGSTGYGSATTITAGPDVAPVSSIENSLPPLVMATVFGPR